MEDKDKLITHLRQDLSETIARLRETTVRLNEALTRIAELERIICLDSHNSSKPPSTDAFRKPKRLRIKYVLKEKSKVEVKFPTKVLPYNKYQTQIA